MRHRRFGAHPFGCDRRRRPAHNSHSAPRKL
jgi:hypothetical protein